MALRHQLWLILPLSDTNSDRLERPVNSGMYVIEWNVRFGSVAIICQGIACRSILILLLPASLLVNYHGQARTGDKSVVAEI